MFAYLSVRQTASPGGLQDTRTLILNQVAQFHFYRVVQLTTADYVCSDERVVLFYVCCQVVVCNPSTKPDLNLSQLAADSFVCCQPVVFLLNQFQLASQPASLSQSRPPWLAERLADEQLQLYQIGLLHRYACRRDRKRVRHKRRSTVS